MKVFVTRSKSMNIGINLSFEAACQEATNFPSVYCIVETWDLQRSELLAMHGREPGSTEWRPLADMKKPIAQKSRVAA